MNSTNQVSEIIKYTVFAVGLITLVVCFYVFNS